MTNLQREQKHSRHRRYPEPDGGIIWFSRPVFDRATYYSMVVALGNLERYFS